MQHPFSRTTLSLAALAGLLALSVEGSTITISYSGGDGCADSVAGSGPMSYGSQQSPVTCTGVTLGGVTKVAGEATLTTMSLLLDGSGPGASRSAQVRVEDTLTVTGGSGAGTLIWHFAMNGTLDAGDFTDSMVYLDSFGGAAFADFHACGAGTTGFGVSCIFDNIPNPPGGIRAAQPHEAVNDIRSISIPFVFGVPLNIDWRFHGVVYNGCVNINSCTPASAVSGVVGSSGAGLFNVNLLPLEVVNTDGSQALGAVVMSDSGFSYGTEAEIPEPSSLILLGTGLVVCLGLGLLPRRAKRG